MQLNEAVNDKIIEHQLLGILMQDAKKLAASYHGEVLKRNIHAIFINATDRARQNGGGTLSILISHSAVQAAGMGSWISR